MHRRFNDKLSPRYFGLFLDKRVIGKVAYQLDLPAIAQIHDFFHVSQLKSFHGELPRQPHVPTGLHAKDSSIELTLAAILDRKLVKRHN